MRSVHRRYLWWSFSVVICGVFCIFAWSWLNATRERTAQQAAAIRTIINRCDESMVFYDYQVDTSKDVRIWYGGVSGPPWSMGAKCYTPSAQPPSLTWLRRLFGDCSFSPVIAVAAWNLDDRSSGCLESLPQLRYLGFADSRITDVGLKHIRGLTELRILDFALDGERISAITDVGLANLKGLTKLEGLNLACANLTGSGLEYLGGLYQLRELDLQGTKVNDSGLEHLSGLVNIQFLGLRDTRITNRGLTHLRGMERLSRLDISGNAITDEGLNYLRNMKRLKSLLLQNVDITDAGLEHLKKMKSLRCVYLSRNHITNSSVDALRKVLPGLYVIIDE